MRRIAIVLFLVSLASPANSQGTTPEEKVRYESIYVKVELFRDGQIKSKVEMVPSMNTCRSSVQIDERLYNDQGLRGMVAVTGNEKLIPIAVVSHCFQNPRAGECKFDPITRKLIGCWDKK
jgi:hypothetical protein